MTHVLFSLITSPQKPLRDYEKYADIFFRVQDRVQKLLELFTYPFFEINLVGVLCIVFVYAFAFFYIQKHKRKKGDCATA